LGGADWHAFFPGESKVRLLRESMVNCHQAVCEAVLESHEYTTDALPGVCPAPE